MTNSTSRLKSQAAHHQKTQIKKAIVVAAALTLGVAQSLVFFLPNENFGTPYHLIYDWRVWEWYIALVSRAFVGALLSIPVWEYARPLPTVYRLSAIFLGAALWWVFLSELVDEPLFDVDWHTSPTITALFIIFLIVLPIIPIVKWIQWRKST